MRWIAIMLYAVTLPLCYLALLLRARTAQRTGDSWLVEKCEGEWIDLKEVYFYWEAIVLFKKLLLAGFLTQAHRPMPNDNCPTSHACAPLSEYSAQRTAHCALLTNHCVRTCAPCLLSALRTAHKSRLLLDSSIETTRVSLSWLLLAQVVPGTLVQTNLALISALCLFAVQSYAQPYDRAIHNFLAQVSGRRHTSRSTGTSLPSSDQVHYLLLPACCLPP